eukprot:6460271-Amphidinium_carterae.1
MDQGGEFAGEFIQAMEEMAMPTRIAGSHSPWQVAIGERHGQVLGFMMSAAKNAQMKRSGYSPEQMVFGRSLEWLNDLCNMEVERPRLPVLTQQQEHWRAAVLRHRAAQAFHRLAISDKMRRAMLRSSPPAKEYLVGESVYFWTPGARRGSRLVPDAGRWRGPASVLSKEGERRYYLGWRGRLLLASMEQLRPASIREQRADVIVKSEAALQKELAP